MKVILSFFCSILILHLVAAPPPRRSEKDHKDNVKQEKEEVEDFGLEYNRYLKEVIDLLESDPEFKKKLEDAQEADIRSGQIAKELEFVDHKVRTKLDEVKRQEIERLRHLAQKQNELSNGIDTEHVKVSSEHLDHENPHTFEMEDLKKLIAKVSSDLNEADEKRRQEFKEYEMQKEFEKQQKLKHLEGSEKEAFEKQLKENETKHKQHEPLHHPGSKQQLEEVWEKQDHMENQEFDPKIFFQLHDLDGNGFWDHNEVKTLFLKELDKMYEAGAPEDDMKERVEEMERMREHVFSEADKNKDGLISYQEFLDKTKQPDFEKDSGWETLDQKPVYTHEEYQEFERRRQEEIQRMIQQGLIPPQPVFHPAPGYHPPPQYVQYHHPQFQAHPQGHDPSRYAQNFQQPSSIPAQPYHSQGGVYPNPPHQIQLGHLPPPIMSQQGQQNQGYHEKTRNNHPQNFQQPSQEFQNHQFQQNQPSHNQQGYQRPQAQQNEPSNNPQGYQQSQVQQNQGLHGPSQGISAPPQRIPGHSPQNYGSQNFQYPPQQAYKPGQDPNEIHPNEPQQSDSKYSKNVGSNSHPNHIESNQKKLDEKSNEPKFHSQ